MKSQPPRVSIIIPTYNRAHLLCATLQSVIAQTYPHLEIIVVDDGSTDETAKIVAELGRRVIYIQQANQGVAAARNKGYQASTGDYVTFLDDDDLILPNKISRQVYTLSRSKKDLVHCRYYFADPAGHYLYKTGLLPEGKVLPDLVRSNFVWMGAPMIRRSCLERVGLFDEEVPSVTADWDLWLRVALDSSQFACVQAPLGVYRVLPDSMVTDVFTLEEGMLTVLDKTFSNPQLPGAITKQKQAVYGEIRFWLACRYYDTGYLHEGRRNLAEALALRPELLAPPIHLARLLRDNALDPRVVDPFEFIARVIQELPAPATGLLQYRPYIYSHIYLGLALRSYATGQIEQAQENLRTAIEIYPQLVQEEDEFIQSTTYHALHLPLRSPVQYVDRVLQNLPAEALPLARVRQHLLGDVTIGCAFQDFFAGRRQQVVHSVFTGLRYRPAWLANRGVVSMLLQSLLGLGRTQSYV